MTGGSAKGTALVLENRMKAALDIAVLARFLIDAHRNTYADKKAAKVPATRLRSFDYRFARGDLAYHDTHFGMRDFIGAEVIYRQDVPIWGMNYYGVILGDDAAEREVYDFLRDALKQECVEIEPARGPRSYRHSSWSYANTIEGQLDDFCGTELIHLGDRLLYRCRYHGGWVS